MRGIDTNVLLRLVLLDEPNQAAAVQRLVRRHAGSREPIFVTSIVLCEFTWVLRRAYRFARTEVADALDRLMASDLLLIEHDESVRAAVDLYRDGPGDFADYLIGAVSHSAGCRDIVTFDHDLRSAPGFTVL